jgi:hypothetical protein
MVDIIETQASNIITLLRRYGRQELFDGADLVFSDLAIEDGTVDQVRLDRIALDTVQANVAIRVDQLAQMDMVVFFSDEADNVCRRRGHLVNI